ncbi:Hypothetical Protein FCC1311_074672 [Hondaea fermentalgiana]|uniref:DH domain-containing protein n=1 Tax=Hondaea fermentalgiana TaxID=2315210 RepID=A0A2R5GK13_9STRA|nr:Hypothetical Protein FCC1311_074672 [Hondaea fermentalgiana]|eukprot:GBG31246.1 Hypothetical Protein FCC1311_074672 [Hondaea fermentalgiana]
MAEETARGAAQEAATDEGDVTEEVAELADLAARDARRERLAKELLDSETRYASVLEAFETVDQLVAAAICAEGFGEGQDLDEDLDLYEGPADAALARHQPLVSPRMRCLFATMRQLAVLSRATALALQKSMREYGPDRVGAILVRFADATYLYEEYAGAHTSLQQEIARLGSHPEFVQIWRRAARLVANKGLALPAIFPAQDGATAAATSGFTSSFSFSSSSSSTFTTSSQLPTTLSSFLILPIQRIPRYEMLLEEMRREANAVESLEALSAHLGTGRKSYDWWAKEQLMQLRLYTHGD